MRRFRPILAAVLSVPLCGGAAELMVVPGLTGSRGGRLNFAQRIEPKTFNPLVATDGGSREVIGRLMADLIHINRQTMQTEPALAKSWTVSPDGRHFVLELRRDLRFSDGQPFDADDVLFTFQALLDEKVQASQRDLWILDGKPIAVRKLDSFRVAVDLPTAYAAGARLFDGVAMLPRRLLAKAYQDGKLGQAWGLRTSPAEIAGLGPFRLKEYVPGQRILLERNPYYWKTDAAGVQLPYLNELDFLTAGTEDMQVLRLQSGESDLITRLGARNYVALEKESQRKGLDLRDAGPGLEFSFLFFNLADLPANAPGSLRAHQAFLRRRAFRQAVSAAIDRNSMARLVYLGYAVPLGTPVPAGNKAWIDAKLPAPQRSVSRARALLAADGFKWSTDGSLVDPQGHNVEFTIVTSSSNPERLQMATLIQDDLKPLGMKVEVVPLEFRSMLDRVQRTHEYEAAILSMLSGDADPNPDINVWLSSGSQHWWNPAQKSPVTTWEAEIDALMRRQMVTLEYPERKRMFDRVQELLVENAPLIPLLSPDILVGARRGLGNFRPAILDHYTLWNVDELYWSAPGTGSRR